MTSRHSAHAPLLRLKWRLAFDRWEQKLARWVQAAKASFDPNQPRVPSGRPDGGQWTGGGGRGGGGSRPTDARRNEGQILSDVNPENLQKPAARLAQARGPRGGSLILFRGERFPATPSQRMRFGIADRRAKRLLSQVGEIDPTWKPRLSLTDPTSTSRAIAIRRGEAEEAEARLRELARQSPSRLIDTYRTLNNSRDLFGNESWPRNRDTVAITTINRVPIVGINSRAPTYTARDRRTADIVRDTLIAKYPEIMKTGGIGRMPNNAVYHAEATILLRAAKANRGSLIGQRFEVRTDRPMCKDCRKVLPKLGQELGNPTMTFISPNGARRTMRDGKWAN